MVSLNEQCHFGMRGETSETPFNASIWISPWPALIVSLSQNTNTPEFVAVEAPMSLMHPFWMRCNYRLLRSALHSLATRVTIFIILVHHALGTAEDLLGLSIQLLQIGGLGHSIGRGNGEGSRGGEDLSERLEGGLIDGPVLLGELDVESDVHVAGVVVSGRGHALAADHLDSIF